VSESLNAEAVLASIVELRAGIAEQGKQIAEEGKRLDFPKGYSAKAW